MAITLALVGAPNCGKTATFNALTGAKAKIASTLASQWTKNLPRGWAIQRSLS